MNRTAKKDDTSADEILSFLKEGEAAVASINESNLILLMGTTGAGKSALQQLLAGDNSTLVAKPTSTPGDYLISDNNNLIGNETANSKTVFPSAIQLGDNYIVDCPGFSDVRTVKYDFATTYVVKKLLERAKTVKIVFVINHNSVVAGADRLGFREFLKHAATFLKEVNKYVNSIGFVVSKVGNDFAFVNGGYSLVSDSIVLQSIDNFIAEVSSALKNKDANLAKLFEVMQQRYNNSELKNWAIFRKPERPGPISASTFLQKCKTNIMAMINGLDFVEPLESDFNISLKEKSMNVLVRINEDLFLELGTVSDQIGDGIATFYKSLFRETSDIHDFYSKMIGAKSALETAMAQDCRNVENYLKNVINPFMVQQKIPKTYQIQARVTFKSLLDRANELAVQIQFFKYLVVTDPKNFLVLLQASMDSAMNEIIAMQNRALFLIELNAAFSSYEIQAKMGLYQELGLDRYVQRDITVGDFPQFLEKLTVLPKFRQIKVGEMDELALPYLRKIFEIVKTPDLTYSKNGTTLEVRGAFVALSKISKEQLVGIQFLEVFAENKIFIDSDIEARGVNVALVAPTVEIVDNHLINLDGVDGKAQPNAKSATYTELFSPCGIIRTLTSNQPSSNRQDGRTMNQRYNDYLAQIAKIPNMKITLHEVDRKGAGKECGTVLKFNRTLQDIIVKTPFTINFKEAEREIEMVLKLNDPDIEILKRQKVVNAQLSSFAQDTTLSASELTVFADYFTQQIPIHMIDKLSLILILPNGAQLKCSGSLQEFDALSAITLKWNNASQDEQIQLGAEPKLAMPSIEITEPPNAQLQYWDKPGCRAKKIITTVAEAGKPGFPGGSAGDFFACTTEFSGSGHLKVTLNGGNGGAGQNGGHGYKETYDSIGLHGADGGKQGFGGISGQSKINCANGCGTYVEFSNEPGRLGAPGLGGKRFNDSGSRGLNNVAETGLQQPQAKLGAIQELPIVARFALYTNSVVPDPSNRQFMNFRNYLTETYHQGK